jgi:hypothetical protein
VTSESIEKRAEEGNECVSVTGHFHTKPLDVPELADVLFYDVVSAQTEKVVEFFLECEAAETMIGEVREDEPVLAKDLRVEAIELE